MTKDVTTGGDVEKTGRAVWLWVWLFLIFATGVFYGYFHNLYVSNAFRPRNLDLLSRFDNPLIEKTPALLLRETFKNNGKDTNAVWLDGKETVIPFVIDEQQTMRLRVKMFFTRVAYGKPSVRLSMNGKWSASIAPRWEDDFENFSFTVPRGAFRPGGNEARISIAGGGSRYVMGIDTVNLRNYTGINKRLPRAYVTFEENYPANAGGAFAQVADYVIFPTAIFLMWVISANVLCYGARVELSSALRRVFYAYIPVTLPFVVSAIFSESSPYTVVFFPEGFFMFFAFPPVLVVAYSAVRFAASRIFRGGTAAQGAQKTGIRRQRAPLIEIGSITGPWNKAKAVVSAVARYSGKSAVVAFALFLMIAGFLLIIKKQDAAEMMADTAYFFLVYGVIMSFFDIRKDEGP